MSIVGHILSQYIYTMKKRTTKPNHRTPLVELQAMPNGGGSDITLKKDIQEIRFGLKRILSLRPVTWRWSATQKDDRLEHGFIAQEVEEVIPGLVSLGMWEDGTERKFLSTKEMIPYLVAAIQEQQKEIEELRSRLGIKAKPEAASKD